MPGSKTGRSESIPAFNASPEFTMGVEIEFQTLALDDLDLAPLAPLLLAQAPALLAPRLSPEFIQSILEIQTGVCRNLQDVENDLMQTISMAEELACDNNCLLFSASLHPFARHREQLLTLNDRYRKIMDDLQLIGRRFISQGFHVHVGVAGGDAAMKVGNLIQAFLPLLLALSTSSPFFQGEDTGLMSYRTKLFESLPLAGLYPYFENWEAFAAEMAMLMDAGIITAINDMWWDTRPNPRYGTVEVRICDLPIRFTDILGITALIQALVATLAEAEVAVKPLNRSILEANKWQAVRYGLQGLFLDPSGILGKRRIPITEAIDVLLELISPKAKQLRGEKYLPLLKRILREGTGADFLRNRYRETGDFHHVIRSLHKEFWL